MCPVHVINVTSTSRKIVWFCCTDLLLFNVMVQENIQVSYCVIYPLSLGEVNWLPIPPSFSARAVLTLCGEVVVVFNTVDALQAPRC